MAMIYLILFCVVLHRQKLIHTDIKPENMMLKDTNSKQQPLTVFDNEANQPVTVQRQVLLNADMQLIDFGSATFENEYHSAIVSTRHYRAPEVILNLGWSYPCDIWSIGCVLFELCIGEPLFQTKQDHQHLALMEKMISRFPTHIMNHPRYTFYSSTVAQKQKANSSMHIGQRDTLTLEDLCGHRMKLTSMTLR